MGQINHSGRVVKVEKDKITVEIISRAACQECAARKNCGLADCQSKMIEVTKPQEEDFVANEEVSVGIETTQGFYAIWLVYLIPLILVLGILILSLLLGFSEQNSGIFSIIILIPYYFGLFLSQKELRRQFRFTISKK